MNGKWKLLIFVFVAVLFFTGCAKTSHKTVIQFSSWGSQSEVEILKPILAEFEHENPDIKVDFVHIPQNYFQKIHLLFASNMPPDVIFINNLNLPIYANAGMLEEVKSEKEKVKSDLSPFTFYTSPFYPKALESLSYNGKLYAIPRDVSNLVVFYNKDIFNKYNVDLPNKFWSLDDMLILAAKLTIDTDGDGQTDIWGISFEEDPLFYLPYLMSEGGGILSDDGKRIIIDTPQSKKGLNFYADLRNKYNVAPKKSESASATMAQMFLQGKLALQVSGRWLVPKYLTDAKFNWGVINFPSGDAGSVVPLDASGWAIAKSSKHKKEAMRLIEFLSSKNSIERLSKSGLIVPARIDVAEDEFLNNQNSIQNTKMAHVFVDVIKTSKPTPVSVNYSEIQDKIKEKTNYLFNAQ